MWIVVCHEVVVASGRGGLGEAVSGQKLDIPQWGSVGGDTQWGAQRVRDKAKLIWGNAGEAVVEGGSDEGFGGLVLLEMRRGWY